MKKITWWPKWCSRCDPKNGHVRVEPLAKCVLEKWRLCEHSCLPPRHHHNESRRKDTRLIKTKYKDWIQVDQLTKHIWCTKWNQVILWYGKQLPIVLCELTHDICVWCFYMWLGIFTWACIKRKSSCSPWEDDIKCWSSSRLRSASSRWASRRLHASILPSILV